MRRWGVDDGDGRGISGRPWLIGTLMLVLWGCEWLGYREVFMGKVDRDASWSLLGDFNAVMKL